MISFLEEVMHDPELLTQERKAAGNIIRQVMQVPKGRVFLSLSPQMGVLMQGREETVWDLAWPPSAGCPKCCTSLDRQLRASGWSRDLTF